MLPETFLHKTLKDRTMIITEGKIWNVTEEDTENKLVWYGKKFGIKEERTLKSIEEDYMEKYEKTIKEIKEKALEKHKIKADDFEIAYFAINHVIGHKKEGQKSSIIEEIVKENLFSCANALYKLKKGRHPNHKIRIGKEVYSIDKKIASLEQLERNYALQIVKKITSKFKEKSYLEPIHAAEFYNKKENIGFERKERGFYAYTILKPYILYENCNGKYYKLGEAKIGVKLSITNQGIGWNDPVVINNYVHPALESFGPYQRICSGKFSYESIRQRHKEKGKQVRAALEQGKRMIERGYFSQGGSWHKLTEPYYRSMEIMNLTGRRVANI